jgi:hypothetical protein
MTETKAPKRTIAHAGPGKPGNAPTRPTRTASPSVAETLSRIETASSPWWAQTPAVAYACLRIAAMPVRLVAAAADAAVSLAFVAMGAAVYMWWTGMIPDEAVAEFLGRIGERLLDIVRSSGLI